ncbi:MAG: hypothetical protein JWN17_1633, partial [Frankiales bacterium]|nr:hypothetical protein [Frankiales bacterium]
AAAPPSSGSGSGSNGAPGSLPTTGLSAGLPVAGLAALAGGLAVVRRRRAAVR